MFVRTQFLIIQFSIVGFAAAILIALPLKDHPSLNVKPLRNAVAVSEV